MQLETETFGKVLVVHTPDELTDDTASAFLDALSSPLENGHVKVVLQMDQSETFDSIGLTTLLDLQDMLREKGGNLTISGLNDPGRKIFELTRLDQRFEIFASVIDAVGDMQ